MNTERKPSLAASLKGKLLLRLWAANMFLVAIALAFLWVVQIRLFEPNYLSAIMDELYTRASASARELKDAPQINPYDKDNPMHFLSKTITGIAFLLDRDGKILYAYNNGRMADVTGMTSDYAWLLRHHPVVAGGAVYKEVEQLTKSKAIVIGVPATYLGEPVVFLLYNYITQVDTLQALNRRQLLKLSLLLTLMASLISFVLARHFSRPIQKIKGAVERLTEGDFSAASQVRRSDELGALSDSVEELGRELRRVDVLRKEVIANVSHELRAPLALITGYGEMVRDVTGGDGELRRQNMELIIREANRLSEMVDDIMDFSQMQAGYAELKLEVCNLYELAQSSAEYSGSAARQYDVSVLFESYSDDIPVSLDAMKLSQVMRNLLNNAINHTENGRSIEVRIARDENAVVVSVTNPGEEIPADRLEQIWERYQRVQHQGGRKEGTGIGLAIVSTILAAHGMDYGADSGGGRNRFWFSISNDRILKVSD